MSKPKSPKTVAKSIQSDYDRHRNLIEESMRDLNPGSAAYLNRVIALAKLAQSHRQELVDRGILPSNLGAATKTVYHFVSTTEIAPDTRNAARKLLEEQYDHEFGYTYDDPEDGGGISVPSMPAVDGPRNLKPQAATGRKETR
jgi:hypothetical protein